MTATGRLRRVWKGRNIAIWTVLSAVVVFVLVSLLADLGALERALIGFPAGILLPIAALSLGNYILRFVKWHWYLKLLDQRIPRFSNVLVFLSGFALTVTPGKVGEFVKAYIVKERFAVPYTASTAVLLMERFTDLAAIVLLSCIGVLFFFSHWWTAVIAVLVMAALLLLLRNRAFAGWFIDRTASVPVLRRFRDPLRTFYEEGWILLEGPVFFQSLLLSLAAWSLEGIGYTLAAWGLGEPISLLEGVFIYSVALLGGALTLFLGGLGATEGGMVGLGIVFGMSPSTSAAATIIIRVMTLWFAVMIGWAVFIFTPGLRSLLKAARSGEPELTSEELEVGSGEEIARGAK